MILGAVVAISGYSVASPAGADPDPSATPTADSTGDSTGDFRVGGTIAEVRKQLDELEKRQAELAAERTASQEKLKAAQSQLDSTREQIAVVKADMSLRQDQLSQIALQQYQDRGLGGTARIMLSTSTDDLLGYISAMQQVTDTANTLFAALQAEQGTLAELERGEQASVAAIAQRQKELDALDKEAKAKVVEATLLLNGMMAVATARSNSLAGVNAVGIGVADPAKVVPNPSAKMISPIAKYTVTDSYGMRIHPFTGAYSFHNALDMAAPCGTPIVAPANGFVMDYYWTAGYGNRMVVDQGIIDGHHVVTSFNHLSAGVARPGSSVNQGQVIALVGSTGESTGCHLHYMIWIDGETVDPAQHM